MGTDKRSVTLVQSFVAGTAVGKGTVVHGGRAACIEIEPGLPEGYKTHACSYICPICDLRKEGMNAFSMTTFHWIQSDCRFAGLFFIEDVIVGNTSYCDDWHRDCQFDAAEFKERTALHKPIPYQQRQTLRLLSHYSGKIPDGLAAGDPLLLRVTLSE